VLQAAASEVRPAAPGDMAKTDRILAALPPYAAWLHTLRTKPMDWIHIAHSTAFDEACKQLRREVADYIDPDLHEAYGALAAAAYRLKHEMDGMYGPDPGSPWRVLTNHAPQRPEQLEKLTAARDHFDEKYLALINHLNQKDLLHHDPPTGPQPTAHPSTTTPQAEAERADDTNAIQALQGMLRYIVNSSPYRPSTCPSAPA